MKNSYYVQLSLVTTYEVVVAATSPEHAEDLATYMAETGRATATDVEYAVEQVIPIEKLRAVKQPEQPTIPGYDWSVLGDK